jgi:cell division septation protein DedD
VETQVKERLTGALILVVAMIIIVPELLSGSRHSSAPPVPAASSADQGPPVRSYTLELGAATQAPTAGESALTPKVPNVPPAATPQPRAAPPPPADVAAIPAPPAPKPGAWQVQVGSFSRRDNAQKVADALSAAGFPAVVAPIRSGNKELFRVRAGSAANRAAAIKLQATLAAAGHKGTLVAP